MSISTQLRDDIRRRADYACQFCGVTETDAGGQLTIDHFQPKTKGGRDDLINLLYCCIRCNQHKLNYWPVASDDPVLWHPNQETASTHFLVLDDGRLRPLTPTGEFTLKRLRLNRPALIAHRQRKQQQADYVHLLANYRNLVLLMSQVHQQTTDLLTEQQDLLREQQRLLNILLAQIK